VNSNIRSVIRLKSPSIKLLWLLIYNLYATGRLIVLIHVNAGMIPKAFGTLWSNAPRLPACRQARRPLPLFPHSGGFAEEKR